MTVTIILPLVHALCATSQEHPFSGYGWDSSSIAL
jgi:hypothetical protein